MLNKESEEWAKAPLLVKIGLYTISTRRTAVAYQVFSLVLGVILVAGGFFYLPLFAGVLVIAAAFWYAMSIRWVDNAGLWDKSEP